ncbi:MAG: hypothetical protein KC613_26155 [Myxococcales bacterium]|nr:hypothetical protein [Myxococcales bacterium]MCB9525556.1 hypothetical protein [Myxococcales bacterium]
MARRDGPGVWWQLLEFMGMTWPGRKGAPPPPDGPPCPACGNPTEVGEDGRARCPHHPNATIDPQG